MKRYFLFLSMAATAFLLASCTKDATEEVVGGDPATDDGEEYVYLSAQVTMPVSGGIGTRSATDDQPDSPSDAHPDTEEGYDYESNVSTCLLVLADKDNKFIGASAISGIRMTTLNGRPGFTATAKFPRKQIEKAYQTEAEGGELKGENKFRVFAFCNNSDLVTRKIAAIGRGESSFTYTRDGQETPEDLSDDLSLLTGYVEEDPMQPGATPAISNNIWTPNRFMMSNAKIKEVQFPEKEIDWDNFADASKPFNLSGSNEYEPNGGGDPVDNTGSIVVERLAARFDYRDASGDDEKIGVGNNIYKVLGAMDNAGGSDTQYNLVNIKLSRIGLVNMARDVYYLRRVSKNGLQTGSELCGLETSSPSFNYVVSPHAKNMTDGTLVGDASKWYNFPLFTSGADGEVATDPSSYYNKAKWSMYNLADVTNGKQQDQWNAEPNAGKYKIWRYCTENTIPAGTGASNRENLLQDNLFSTGIVFKGKLIAGRYMGRHRPGSILVGNAEKPAELPYMTYNTQRAILASTLGIDFSKPLDDAKIQADKAKALGENSHLADEDAVILYEPNPKGGMGTEITWEQINDKTFEGMTSYPALYLFEGNLYAGFNEAAEYAYKDGKGGTLYQAMQEIMSHYYRNTKEKKMITVTRDGETKEVEGFLQYDTNPGTDGTDYEQLTVEIFAEILGLRSESQLNKETETFHSGDKYGVQWVKVDGGTADKEEMANFKKWLTSGESNFHFTLYDAQNETDHYGDNSTSQGWGYYCYYFYWNRHNDNGINGVMAPMEFAVVRNNVYKLAVTKINQIGHPTDPSNDPDVPDPHDDDEEQNVYLNLQVEVLPWTVRVNDIQF